MNEYEDIRQMREDIMRHGRIVGFNAVDMDGYVLPALVLSTVGSCKMSIKISPEPLSPDWLKDENKFEL